MRARFCFPAVKSREMVGSSSLTRRQFRNLSQFLRKIHFHIKAVASYQVIEFLPTMAAPALQSLLAA